MGTIRVVWGLLGEVWDIMEGNMGTIRVVWGLLGEVWDIRGSMGNINMYLNSRFS